MGRTAIARDGGMLFIYPWPRIVRIWMVGTALPLDAIFVDRSGSIVKIAHQMEPFSKRWVSSGVRVLWVLEIAAGEARRLDLSAGDSVRIVPQAAA